MDDKNSVNSDLCLMAFDLFLLGYYDNTFFFDLGGETPDPGTRDIHKQDCQKEFFDSVQKHPYQVRFTFCTFNSKSEKKNSTYVEQKIFFLLKCIAFGERIPKRYNTWGVASYF